MPDILVRLGLILAVLVGIWLLVTLVRLFIGRQRRAVLASAPLQPETQQRIRILAFSTPDCQQCKTLQTPALERVSQAYGEQVHVVKIDAVEQPELAQRYHVLTVPTTILLDEHGQAHAVNYGFTPAPRLMEQIQALIA